MIYHIAIQQMHFSFQRICARDSAQSKLCAYARRRINHLLINYLRWVATSHNLSNNVQKHLNSIS